MSSQQRIAFGRRNLDSGTDAIFKRLAAYFSDLFYNFGYQAGKRLFMDKKANSTTDGYRHFCAAFLQSLQKKSFTGEGSYTHMLGSISEFFGKSTGNPMTRGQFISDIFKCYTPSDMHATISNDDMRTFVRDVMLNICNKIVDRIVNENIVSIIDEREKKESQIVLTEDIINILVAERETTMAKFITGQKQHPSIDMGYYNLLRAEYEKELQLKQEMLQQMQQLHQQNELMKHESLRLIEICRELERKNKALKGEVARLENTVYEMKQTSTVSRVGGNANYVNLPRDSGHTTTQINEPPTNDNSPRFEEPEDFIDTSNSIEPQNDFESDFEKVSQIPPRSSEPEPSDSRPSERHVSDQRSTEQPTANQPSAATESQKPLIDNTTEKKKRGRKKKETPETKNIQPSQTLPLATDMGPRDDIFDSF